MASERVKGMKTRLENEEGAALILAVSLLLLITLLGVSAMNVSMDEVRISGQDAAWMEAQYLAESGIALVIQGFQEPREFPDIGGFPNGTFIENRAAFFMKRERDQYNVLSFFDEEGRSQFTGTGDQPDFWFQSGSDGEPFVDETSEGMGQLESIKVFAPTHPGSICTVEATGETLSGVRRTVSIQIIPSPVPPITASIQDGNGVQGRVPVLSHWGDVRAADDADLGESLESIPKKDSLSTIDGEPFPALGREDRWIDFYIGGFIFNPEPMDCPNCPEPFINEGYSNIHQLQNDSQAGFRLDTWSYTRLKAFSKEWGAYYATDTSGALYRDGVMDTAHRVSVSQAVKASDSNTGRRLIFIDTLDGNPPGTDNLPHLTLSVNDAAGLIFIQGHVTLNISGSGGSFQVFSPLAEGSDSESTRQPVTLSNIHLRGVLSAAGRITVEDHPMIFGAVIAQQGFNGPGELEVWYDADLATGYYRGIPVATILKGSWTIR